jgi:hypothetical protein
MKLENTTLALAKATKTNSSKWFYVPINGMCLKAKVGASLLKRRTSNYLWKDTKARERFLAI